MTEIEAKLRNLRLTLPEPLKTPPGLKLPFKPVIVRGKHVYISGHAPQNPDGTIAGPLGKLGKELTLEQGYQAAKLVGLSILGDLKRAIGDLDRVSAWLRVLGMVNVAPGFNQTTGVINGASFIAGPIAPNTWVSIKGSGLSATTGAWQVTGSALPTAVNDVGVTINGTAVPVSFVSNAQVNFLVPSTVSTGPAQIQTTNNGLTSAAVTANVDPLAPAFFTIGTNATTGNIDRKSVV